MTSYFISADWSKDPGKRSVYIADLQKRHIRKGKPSGAFWNLDALLEKSRDLSQEGPVLIGIDAVLGVPEGYWHSVLDERRRCPPETFVDWLSGIDVSGEFFETVVDPYDWSVARPWFKVLPGTGGRTSFTNKVDGGMLRRVDIATCGNPLFAVSGIPGTVGSGTREFWKELIPHLMGDRPFAIWPFDGDLVFLLQSRGLVICETYPRLAYAAALAESLPTAPRPISKTKQEERISACDRLAQMEWVRANRIDLGDLRAPRTNEDDFDAHITAAAVLRCIHEGKEIACVEWIDTKAEGSMLLAGTVDPHCKTRKSSRRTGEMPRLKAESASRPNREIEYPCPIPGCGKVFSGSRGGWDAHVGSARLHPQWWPAVGEPEERKRLFREEFRHWFD